MPLWYMGPIPTETTSPVDINYVNSLASQSLSDSAVKAEILSRVSSSNYASVSDAASIINNTVADQQFARSTDLSTLSSTKINVVPAGQKSVANGLVALGSSGKVDRGKISGVVPTQRYAQMYWTPSSYNQLSSVAATEQTICPITVTSSFSAYKVFVTGTVNAKVSLDNGQYPVINVRAVPSGTTTYTSTTGPIVATGYGLAENYRGGALTVLSTSALQSTAGYTQTSTLPSSSYSYMIPAWCDKIDVALVGGGGGGINGGLSTGNGGGPGSWLTTTLTKGANLSAGAIALTGVIGQGAGPGSANIFATETYGGATTCVVPGSSSSYSASGGGTGLQTVPNLFGGGTTKGGGGGGRVVDPPYYGSSSLSVLYNGITYMGGGSSTAYGAPGNVPGGGGAGGKASLSGTLGGRGGDGAAFFYAYINDDNPYAQISVVPTTMDAQPTITTPSVTLYVNLVCSSGSGSQVSTDSFNPQVSVMVVPA